MLNLLKGSNSGSARVELAKVLVCALTLNIVTSLHLSMYSVMCNSMNITLVHPMQSQQLSNVHIIHTHLYPFFNKFTASHNLLPIGCTQKNHIFCLLVLNAYKFVCQTSTIYYVPLPIYSITKASIYRLSQSSQIKKLVCLIYI